MSEQIEDGIIKGDLAYKINQFEEAHPEIDLGWFSDLIRDLITSKLNQADAYNAQKPEVTEEFVGKWNQVIAERVNVQMKKDFMREEISLVYPGTENLTEMLEEAGVAVKKKK